MTKYCYDKETGQVVEKREPLKQLPYLDPSATLVKLLEDMTELERETCEACGLPVYMMRTLFSSRHK